MDHLDVDLRGILSKALRIESQEIDIHCSAESSPSWDSLAHLDIVQALEADTGAHFSAKEVASMDSVKQILCVIANHGIKDSSGLKNDRGLCDY